MKPMRICIVYDCLFPWTIGGAERWYRALGERLAADGHEVTYLTLRQWDEADTPMVPGVKVIPVAGRMLLYDGGKRRVLPPILFGIGIFLHFLRYGRRYDYVHTASFPFFSLLAIGALRPVFSYRIAVDWIEVWTRDYWRSYLGSLGVIGWWVQRASARFRQRAYSFSQLHGRRAENLLGLTSVEVLPGFYDGKGDLPPVGAAVPAMAVYAGRMIPEKRIPLLIDALALCMDRDSSLRATIFGRGPEFERIAGKVADLGLRGRVSLPGFVEQSVMEEAMASASVLVQPSEREGYGIVVAEASARGTPVVVIEGPDNAATELVDDGENGFKAKDAQPETLAACIEDCLAGGEALRRSTRDWYQRNAHRLSMQSSMDVVIRDLASNMQLGG
jgi:glycosyltransferase involved in cell wall biosynthesis